MEDSLILVSPKDRKTGVAAKMLVHQQGLRHRAISIFIFDHHGRLLLQQRAPDKYHSGGLWTNTCCGHPCAGERTRAAAKRRLREEMGLTCKIAKVTSMLYHEQVSNQLIEHEFDHVFAGISETAPRANPEEAQNWQWLSLADVVTQLEQSPEQFTVWFRRVFEQFGIAGVQQWFEAARASRRSSSASRVTSVAGMSAWTVPALHCPAPFRIDDALAEAVEDRFMSWVIQTGIFPGQRDKLRAAGFGRFAMLCHTDTDDPDRLLLQAQCMGALFSVDDYYCDDEKTGSEPRLVGQRLARALGALEPFHLAPSFRPALNEAFNRDPVLVALQDYMKRVEALSTPAQTARVRHEICAMFISMAGEAGWRMANLIPPLWEYLSQRQVNSFLPCLSLIDVIGGYDLTENVYSAPAVRQVTALAASATILANDLYSAAKENQTNVGNYNLPLLLMREQQCSIEQAMAQSAAIHNKVMGLYEAAEQAVLPQASPLLQRYLTGLKSWLAGNLEWHRTSARYKL
ncbi:isopentenyl-diphosphate delta-isomerase [Pseudomonas baetica]|uniref:Isopentenyl-diphosphate Delta-isomerase n=2 Tax=Pseudomonas baetica TaxID=674054 RepID=A0ABX4PUY2_9PSED|nr:isopentenyl-diphosphate Delta-isomerase [Pseudomonas baetica]PKA67991.1 isopentenyl-diphosphate delta-isomerase [Pseudomonas baetica]PTC18126.1 hypothetical protein C0J26_19075 [Pseudomonas baetica]